jgi:5-methylcytosine-specific restriction endonuclease McrA
MPYRPPLGCPEPGCPNTRPCPDHPGTSPWARRMPPGWAATRRRILDRDGHRCVQCGAKAAEVHHAIDGREDDASLVSLCHRCHRAITTARAAASRGG